MRCTRGHCRPGCSRWPAYYPSIDVQLRLQARRIQTRGRALHSQWRTVRQSTKHNTEGQLVDMPGCRHPPRCRTADTLASTRQTKKEGDVPTWCLAFLILLVTRRWRELNSACRRGSGPYYRAEHSSNLILTVVLCRTTSSSLSLFIHVRMCED